MISDSEEPTDAELSNDNILRIILSGCSDEEVCGGAQHLSLAKLILHRSTWWCGNASDIAAERNRGMRQSASLSGASVFQVCVLRRWTLQARGLHLSCCLCVWTQSHRTSLESREYTAGRCVTMGAISQHPPHLP